LAHWFLTGYVAAYIDGMGKKLDKVDELKDSFPHVHLKT